MRRVTTNWCLLAILSAALLHARPSNDLALLYLNAFRTTNVKFCRCTPRNQGVKQERIIHARVIYIMAQLAAVFSYLKEAKAFYGWHLHLFYLPHIDFRFVSLPSNLFCSSTWIDKRIYIILIITGDIDIIPSIIILFFIYFWGLYMYFQFFYKCRTRAHSFCDTKNRKKPERFGGKV